MPKVIFRMPWVPMDMPMREYCSFHYRSEEEIEGSPLEIDVNDGTTITLTPQHSWSDEYETLSVNLEELGPAIESFKQNQTANKVAAMDALDECLANFHWVSETLEKTLGSLVSTPDRFRARTAGEEDAAVIYRGGSTDVGTFTECLSEAKTLATAPLKALAAILHPRLDRSLQTIGADCDLLKEMYKLARTSQVVFEGMCYDMDRLEGRNDRSEDVRADREIGGDEGEGDTVAT